MIFEKHTTLIFNVAISRLGLPAGTAGEIMHVYDAGQAYEIEFLGTDGTHAVVETFPATELGELNASPILQAASRTFQQRLECDPEFAKELLAELVYHSASDVLLMETGEFGDALRLKALKTAVQVGMANSAGGRYTNFKSSESLTKHLKSQRKRLQEHERRMDDSTCRSVRTRVLGSQQTDR